MLPLPAASRQVLVDDSVARRRARRRRRRHHAAAVGVGVSSVLLAAVAQGAYNPLWPPTPDVAIESLATQDYWPSDEAYSYGVYSSTGHSGSPGQWWLYSFVPERASGAVVLRQPDLPAGLSVDAAWRYTQGTPAVVLAFLDDGIDLTNADLVEGIYLNVGELKHHPPTHADGSACAPLDPSAADASLVDCSEPADGVVSIADYREALGWSEGVIGLDPNGNGVLDPEDVLLLYADGEDNDGNGLIDDIAGFDFVDFDNTPTPVFATSGTEAALDAAARANNDSDRAGVCPNCRILPIRVGHRRDASAQATALGLLYASALGVTASLVGHSPQGRCQVLDAALKTAAERGLLTLLVRDGEQQSTLRHHFDSDSVRVIGTLTQLIDSPATTTSTTGSFIATDPCQSFEPGPTLFASAPYCSRRGPAIALGVAGLAASAARQDTTAMGLSARELDALLAHSSDSLDPGWTTSTASPTTASAPLLRLNANQAVADALADVVPPELELERPTWHETMVLDSLALNLSVVGRVSAPRAATYDVVVDLAVGRNPSDSDFEVVAPQQTLPGGTPLAAGTTLAELDLRTWYGARAPSGPLSTTGLVATLRVRVIAHPTDETTSEGDVTSEVRREIVLVSDTSLLPGFPYALGAAPTAPKLVDFDDDGSSEIVVGTVDGRLLALTQKDGSVQDSFRHAVKTKPLPAFQRLLDASKASSVSTEPLLFAGTPTGSAELGREPVVGPAALADLTKDGETEVVFAGSTGRLYVVDSDGSSLEGWPRCISSRDLNDCSTKGADNTTQTSTPVVVDIDGDHRFEIVVAARNGLVHAFELNGDEVEGWPLQVETPDGEPAQLTCASPAAADMNGDQIPDLVVGFGEPRDSSAPATTWYVTILGAAAPALPSIAPHWPVAILSNDLRVDDDERQSPPPALDTSDHAPLALLYGNDTDPFFLPITPGTISPTSKLPRNAEPDQDQNGATGFTRLEKGADSLVTDYPVIAPLFARPVLGDLDRDGKVDLVLPASTEGTLFSLRSMAVEREHRGLLAFWNGATGKMLPASPIPLGDVVGTAAPIIADLNNDGYAEVITTDGAGAVVAYDACGRSPDGWPKIVGGVMSQSPAVGDLDDDDLLEVVAVTDDGRIFAWKTEADAKSFVPWGSALHDNLNQSAHYAPENAKPKYVGPLPLAPSGRCLPDKAEADATTAPVLSARGGCSCSLPNSSTERHSWLACVASLLVGLWRRNNATWRAAAAARLRDALAQKQTPRAGEVEASSQRRVVGTKGRT